METQNTRSHGSFVWFDLMTTDTKAAEEFYKNTIGWSTVPWQGDQPYTMFAANENPMGGLMELPDEVKKDNVPPHWIGYMSVDDVDKSVATAEQLGGAVIRPAWDIPEVGRVAILADPQGAVFAIYKPLNEEPQTSGDKSAGTMAWHELNTTDYESAWKFYSELAGWRATSSESMGPGLGTYFMFQKHDTSAEGSMGGMSNVAKSSGFPPYWVHYTTVEDLDATVERVRQHGGEIIAEPMEVPGGDRIAHCKDPQGATFALHCPKK